MWDGKPSGKPVAGWPSWGASAWPCEQWSGKAGGDANAWIGAYAAKDGWFRLDQAQRRLEAWVANLRRRSGGASVGCGSGRL